MAASASREHLVVLCHGLHGTARSMAAIAEALSKQHPSLLVHISAANTGAFLSVVSTARGLLVGGANLAREVRELVAAHPSVRRLSLVGVSLGGLFIRAALPGIRAALPTLPIANLVTFATPHLGVRRHLHRVIDAVVGSGTVVGTTGLHLLMLDKDGAGGMPLLQWMADPRSPYWQALASVQNRVLVANVLVDDKVPHWSAALACNDAVLPRIAASRPDLVECIYMELKAVLFAAARADGKAVVHDETSPEASMMVGLRSMGGWINVDVLFMEPLALPLNHLRIAVSAPGIAWHGQDVLNFVTQHVFLVGPG